MTAFASFCQLPCLSSSQERHSACLDSPNWFKEKYFEVCHKPDPGTEITFAYFHLSPYVFVSDNGSVTRGIEANMANTFAAKYDLDIKWFDAKFSWGNFDKNTQRSEIHGCNN